MKALKLVWSLIRIPRLFVSLLLFPLFLSLIVVYVQLIFTGLILSSTKVMKTSEAEGGFSQRKGTGFLRKYVFKTDEELNEITICRWRGGEKDELPPDNEQCKLSPYDVAIITPQNETFDVEEYRKLFLGNFKKIHICKKKCMTDIVLGFNEKTEPEVHFFSILGASLFEYVSFSDQQVEYRTKAIKEKERVEGLLGKRYFHSIGIQKAVPLDDLQEAVVMIINISSIVVIALWLALKAHRKVLDYFADSGALLPMVAATGKDSFYASIWILTLLRVIAFLVAAVPLCYFTLTSFIDKDFSSLLFGGDKIAFIIWLIALAVSMALATLIASVAELKHRHSVMSIGDRYFPLILCLIGMTYWGLTFLIQTKTFAFLRDLIAALPLVGMGPIILAPVFSPQYGILVVNTLLTLILLLIAARSNTRWFAAHLEDI